MAATAVPRCADAALDVVRLGVLRACDAATRLNALAFGAVRDSLDTHVVAQLDSGGVGFVAALGVVDCGAVPRALLHCATRAAHGWDHVGAPMLTLGFALLAGGHARGADAALVRVKNRRRGCFVRQLNFIVRKMIIIFSYVAPYSLSSTSRHTACGDDGSRFDRATTPTSPFSERYGIFLALFLFAGLPKRSTR